MLELENEINAAAEFHGKQCAGIIIGVRMAVLGLKKIGITDPKGEGRGNIIVFAENDRCILDALESVTGCNKKRGTLKIFNYGKMAASFLNVKTEKAVRVICPDTVRDNVSLYAPDTKQDKKEREIDAYKLMSENELFDIMDVKITLSSDHMLGKAGNRVICPSCNETISSGRGVIVNEKILCTPCAGSCYYKKI